MNTFIIKILCVIGLIFMYQTSQACNYPVQVVDGTECSGVLLSDDQFIEASNNKKKLRLQDLKIAEYEGLEELYDMRHKAYKDELKTAKSELKWYEFKSNLGYVISFGVGAFITGMIARELK